MKIIALIADDRRPEGQPEHYTAPHWDITHEQAAELVAGFVTKFNSSLRRHEIPRRLLSVTIEEIDADDAWRMGQAAYHNEDGKDDNYWPSSHPNHREWLNGWEFAENEDQVDDAFYGDDEDSDED